MQLPDGTLSNLDTGSSFKVSGSTVAYQAANGGKGYSIPCGTNANALLIFGQLVAATSATVIVTSPTWSSINPNSVVHDVAFPNFALVGTGFVAAGITNFQFQYSSYTVPVAPFSVNSDTGITIADGVDEFGYAGTWTLYYSTNGGSSWTTTGLTVTAT